MKNQIQNNKSKKSIKQIIYNFLPKKIKQQIENPYYREFILLGPKERRKRLKHISTPLYYIILNYCYIYCLISIFFGEQEKIKNNQN